MLRRPIAWIVSSVLAFVGSQAAHELSYRALLPHENERAQVLAETGHGYLTLLPLVLAFATTALALALLLEIRLVASGAIRSRPASWPLAAVPLVVFALQEHFERFAHDGSFPWAAATESTFVVGMALQVPFAVLAYLVARLLLRAASSLGERLAAAPPMLTPVPPATWSPLPAHPPRRSVLGRGYGTRGPPRFSIA